MAQVHSNEESLKEDAEKGEQMKIPLFLILAAWCYGSCAADPTLTIRSSVRHSRKGVENEGRSDF